LNQNTRQRITGTIVLAITALVLLPVIFDGQGSYQAPLQTDIPARPVQPEVSRSMPQRPVITADTDAIRIRPESTDTVPVNGQSPAGAPAEVATDTQATTGSAPTPESSSVPMAGTSSTQTGAPPAQLTTAQSTTAQSTTAQPAPALDSRGLPEAWSVRLGSFSNTSNANNLVARLQQAGHRAYSRQVNTSQGVLTAVFVGPLVDRASAQTLMESLRQDFQLNGLIVRYEIEEL
jgi:DedD protein